MAPVEDSIEITASPDVVFAAVSRLEDMGAYSPENTGGKWIGGATGPAKGAKFRGANASGSKTWSTTVTVTDYEPPRAFAFNVMFGPIKVARWSYQVEDLGGASSRVTESWQDHRSALAKQLTKSVRADREAFTRESIATTLRNLKTRLEG